MRDRRSVGPSKVSLGNAEFREVFSRSGLCNSSACRRCTTSPNGGCRSKRNLNMAAIAAEIGYESEAAFSRSFKRMMGVTPSAWRQGVRQDAPQQMAAKASAQDGPPDGAHHQDVRARSPAS